MAPPPPSSSTLADMTVDDADALDCGVCFLPLRPPIFQCVVGHVVCASCRDNLAIAGNCHVCGRSAGYRRCHAMERLVAAVRVPCPHAAHGCVARPAYHDRDAHARACAHAPCRCPGDACRFVASTAELLPHLAAAHGWPCATKTSVGDIVCFTVKLHEGFNFVHATTAAGKRQLFLLNMATDQDAGCAVSVLCIHPHAVPEMKFELEYSRYIDVRRRHAGVDGNQLVNHYQKSEFRVVCTDLSDGLPDPNDGFRFVVPWSVLGDDEDTIQVTASAYTVISC